MVTLDLWNLTWSKEDIGMYYIAWGILHICLHLSSVLKDHPLSSKPLHLPLHHALCVVSEHWNKLKWTHCWAHGCSVLNYRQIRSLSRVLHKPRLCNRCIPLLRVAPRSSDYYLDWMAAWVIVKLDRTPYHPCTAWSTWGRACQYGSHSWEHQRSTSLKRKLPRQNFWHNCVNTRAFTSSGFFFTLLSSSSSCPKWWHVGQMLWTS